MVEVMVGNDWANKVNSIHASLNLWYRYIYVLLKAGVSTQASQVMANLIL